MVDKNPDRPYGDERDAEGEFDAAASLSSFLAAMQGVRLAAPPGRPAGGPAGEVEIAATGAMQGAGLDFSVDSLGRVDAYLVALHGKAPEFAGQPLLAIIWATAMYVGEVIRRAAPAQRFEWISVGEPPAAGVGGAGSAADTGAVLALRSHDGSLVVPTRAVLRVLLRGRKARTVDSFARGAFHFNRG